MQSMKLMFLPSNRLDSFIIEGTIMQTGKKSSLLLFFKTTIKKKLETFLYNEVACFII